MKSPEQPRKSAIGIGEHVASGLVATALLAVADVLLILTVRSQTVRVGALFRAMLDEWALVAWMGTACGLLVGIVHAALRSATWLGGIRERLGSPSRWFRHDPEAFAITSGILVAAAVVAGLAFRMFQIFSVAFAQKHFAATAMALGALGLVLLAVIITALWSAAVRPLTRGIGIFASAGTVGVLLVLGVAALAIYQRRILGSIFENGLWRVYIQGPMLVAAYVLGLVAVRTTLGRRMRSAARRALLLGVALVAGVGLFAWVTLTYGHRQSVREIVERRTIFGGPVVRAYIRAFDRDKDGFAALFADSDCDDRRADVHPGAEDRRGDGVDSDCYAGDGSPNVAPFGNGDYAPVNEGPTRPNFLLVTVDALRSDHLKTYGYGRSTSPRVDEFARHATRFQDVLAPSSRTVAAMPAMMTGLYPSQIARGTQYFYPALLSENTTLAESLHGAGYSTVAIAGTYFFGRVDGYFQGFDVTHQVEVFHSTREWPVDRALDELARLRQSPNPWFMWVHLFNVHADYLGDNHASMFGNSMVGKYDTEVALMDAQFGRLLDALREQGVEDNTVVVFTSDHGEAFGEHGSFYHETLYGEELRSPLIIRVPGGQRAVARAPVSTIDITPTILNLARVPVPRPVPSRSLVAMLDGQAGDLNRVRFAERLPDGWATINQKAIHRGTLKLIWYVEDGRVELYDLARDPREQINIADDRPQDVAQMLGELRAWTSQTASATTRDEDIIRSNRLTTVPAHMDYQVGSRFGGIFTLLGYDLPRTSFTPGEEIPFTFYYRVDQETERDLTIEVLFDTPEGFPAIEWFHGRHKPIQSRYPTFEWHAGEILRDRVVVPIPTFVPRNSLIHLRFRVADHNGVVPYEGDTSNTGVVQMPDIRIQ